MSQAPDPARRGPPNGDIDAGNAALACRMHLVSRNARDFGRGPDLKLPDY